MFTTRSWLAMTLLLVCTPLASAQLRFTQPTADLGELLGGPVYQHRFDFVNDSQLPLEITDLRLGCGCLQPVLAKRIFQAGETGTLLMNIRTLGQPNGVRAWQTRVHYRSADKTQETVVTIAAKIRNEVTIEPSIVAMTVETTLKQELTIKDHRLMPVKISAVLVSSPAIRVSTQSVGEGVTRVILEVSRAALKETRQEEMLNIYTDDPNYRHLQVPITLIKASRAGVIATPEKVEFAGSGSQLVRLRAMGDQAVRIEKADASESGIQCTWASGPGNDATLKINVSRLTSANAVVRVQLSSPKAVTLTIPVTLRIE